MTWEIHNVDCLEFLRTLPSGSVDAVVTDPPYGITAVKNGKCFATSNACKTNTYKEIVGDDKPFDPSHILGLAKTVCLWGANHYSQHLPKSSCWLVWDKRDGCNPNPMADCELAWTNTNAPARLFHHRWMGMIRASERGPRVHPSQKPVALMEWVLETLKVPVGATVIDPYCGSGPVGVACIKTGRNFIGCEIDSEYCDIARRRCKEAEESVGVFAK